MKKIRIIILILGIIAFIPASSYALFDIGAYGGYSFGGKVKTEGSDVEPSGWEYGFIGHYNMTIFPMLLSFGIGAYFQLSPLKLNDDSSYSKKAVGLDGYLQLELPILVHPYVRFSAAIWEDVEGNAEYFKSYSLGGGLAFGIFGILQIYGEYLFNTAIQDGNNAIGNAVHLGLRIKI